jgi:hypothetical protein
MPRRLAVVIFATLVSSAVLAGSAFGHDGGESRHFGPGAPGIGDPYFPLAGNGGYDVRHYLPTSGTSRPRTC